MGPRQNFKIPGNWTKTELESKELLSKRALIQEHRIPIIKTDRGLEVDPTWKDPKRINWTDAAMIQSQLKRKAKRLRAVTQTCCLKRNATTALTLPGYIPELVPEVNIKSLSIGANVVVLKASSEDHSEFLSHSHPYEYDNSFEGSEEEAELLMDEESFELALTLLGSDMRRMMREILGVGGGPSKRSDEMERNETLVEEPQGNLPLISDGDLLLNGITFHWEDDLRLAFELVNYELENYVGPIRDPESPTGFLSSRPKSPVGKILIDYFPLYLPPQFAEPRKVQRKRRWDCHRYYPY